MYKPRFRLLSSSRRRNRKSKTVSARLSLTSADHDGDSLQLLALLLLVVVDGDKLQLSLQLYLGLLRTTLLRLLAKVPREAKARAKARVRAPSSTSLLHLPVSLQQAPMVWNLGLKITSWQFLSKPSVVVASPTTSVLTVSRNSKGIGRTTARTVSGMAGRWLTGTSPCSRSSEIFLAPDGSIRAQDGRLLVRLMVVQRVQQESKLARGRGGTSWLSSQ